MEKNGNWKIKNGKNWKFQTGKKWKLKLEKNGNFKNFLAKNFRKIVKVLTKSPKNVDKKDKKW